MSYLLTALSSLAKRQEETLPAQSGAMGTQGQV